MQVHRIRLQIAVPAAMLLAPTQPQDSLQLTKIQIKIKKDVPTSYDFQSVLGSYWSPQTCGDILLQRSNYMLERAPTRRGVDNDWCWKDYGC